MMLPVLISVAGLLSCLITMAAGLAITAHHDTHRGEVHHV